MARPRVAFIRVSERFVAEGRQSRHTPNATPRPAIIVTHSTQGKKQQTYENKITQAPRLFAFSVARKKAQGTRSLGLEANAMKTACITAESAASWSAPASVPPERLAREQSDQGS